MGSAPEAPTRGPSRPRQQRRRRPARRHALRPGGGTAEPWWGDPSFRILPSDARTGDVRSYHLHIDTTIVERDLESVMPLARLKELEAEGVVGPSAPSHYAFMGYILKPEELACPSSGRSPSTGRGGKDLSSGPTPDAGVSARMGYCPAFRRV